jgi:hypothetical protein
MGGSATGDLITDRCQGGGDHGTLNPMRPAVESFTPGVRTPKGRRADNPISEVRSPDAHPMPAPFSGGGLDSQFSAALLIL